MKQFLFGVKTVIKISEKCNECIFHAIFGKLKYVFLIECIRFYFEEYFKFRYNNIDEPIIKYHKKSENSST